MNHTDLVLRIISNVRGFYEDRVYLTPVIQPPSVNVRVIVIMLFLVMVGTFTSTAFAQQFKEPDYEMHGGEVLGFALDPETATLTILIDPQGKGELHITLPRNLIDAKDGSEDEDFIVLINGLEYYFFDETITSSDRTVTIPFGRFNSEISIMGTQVFSRELTPAATVQPQQQIENKIISELGTEIPDGKAKLLIFSDTKWSGALQASGFDYTEVTGQRDKSIIFGCETSIIREGVFGARFQKMTDEGYLRIVAIQNQKIMDQSSTEERMGEIIINGNCVSGFGSGSGGGACLIATATFGSELAPQVQQLRELRDNKLLQTNSGSAFMSGFNQFYYLFSPTIADWERESPIFKEAVKLTITPLLTSLSILNYVDMDSESEVLGYGISLILLNIGMYFAAPALLITRLNKRFKGL
ncbi:MAG: Peptidyl-prolyl isomerase [Nitrosopumilales archaeon]|nr:MAG: Peptidyl-prolyl isomerase [Nitrosopumilales archaeon]